MNVNFLLDPCRRAVCAQAVPRPSDRYLRPTILWMEQQQVACCKEPDQNYM